VKLKSPEPFLLILAPLSTLLLKNDSLGAFIAKLYNVTPFYQLKHFSKLIIQALSLEYIWAYFPSDIFFFIYL